ncbi:hypothetical protein A2U01_0038904, partial [Trifolium medium]|nr:hypothetical protein [Trifolium medium]
MKVKLGNGVQIATHGMCKEMEIYIGDLKLSPNLHLFELGGIDVVLGIEWLKTLGDTVINWKQQTMCFWLNNKWVTLRGQEGCKKSLVALQSILRKPKPKEEVVLWRIEGLKPKEICESILSEHSHRKEEEVSSKYANVFQTVCESALTESQHRELEEVLREYASVF